MRLRVGMLTAVVVVALVAAAAGTSWCFPTRFGPATGLVDLPTSDCIEQGMAELALDYTKVEGGEKIWPARILFGVSDSAELGIGYATIQDGESEHITSFAGKVTVLREPEAGFGLGVGIAMLNGKSDDLLNVYAVVSKQLPMPAPATTGVALGGARLRTHAGLMFTRVSDGSSDHELKPFVGFDVANPGGTAFVAEYKWTKFGDDHIAAAIRYPVTPQVTVQAGVARAGTTLGQNDYRFILGLSYNLGSPM